MELLFQTADSLALSIYVNGTLTNADTTPKITVTRLSDLVAIATNQTVTPVSTGKYRYPLTTSNNSVLGMYKAVWSYDIQSVTNTKTDFYEVVIGYTSAQEFRDEFPAMAEKTNDEIYRKEKLARRIINIFCGQSFDFELHTTKHVVGQNHNTLLLPRRIFNLYSTSISGTDDISTEIEIFDSNWLAPINGTDIPGFIDIKRDIMVPTKYFRPGVTYFVTADWGWEYVPENIHLAAMMLINDYFCDDIMLHDHGVISSQMLDKQVTFKDDLWGTTGNYAVDQLLADHTYVNMRLI